jgi:rhamnosyltransferase
LFNHIRWLLSVFLDIAVPWRNKAVRMDGGRSDLSWVPVWPSKENICAILVTYFPDQGLCDRLQRTKLQVAHIVIVDNASDRETFGHLQVALLLPGVDLIRNPVNFGIATALNQGVQWARSKGYQWVLLLDQDTLPSLDMVATFIRVFNEFPYKSQLAIIGSNCFLNSATKTKRREERWWGIAKTVITSGSLLALDAAQRIGPFREEFFIDCVDFEFCLRAFTKGFRVVEIRVPVMEHFIGTPKTMRMLWLKTQTYNHRPWRSYYMIRNFVVLVREYVLKDPWWIFRMSWAITKIVALTLLMESSRISKLRYMLLGFYDGLIGRFTRTVI